MTRALLAAGLVLSLGACQRIGSHCGDDSSCHFVDGGYCAKVMVCTMSCDDGTGDAGTGICPGGSACVNYARWVCLHQCKSDGDCGGGEACAELSGGKACVVADPLKRPP